MTIPRNITRNHIIQAIDYINERGTPEDREATKFHLNYENELYPPKYVISIANRFANGEELHPSMFSGGRETNQFLEKKGFQINDAVVNSHSWKVISKQVAIKLMDKSSFLHSETGVPKPIRSFFEIEDYEKGKKRTVTLIYNDKQYEANLILDKMDNPRSKLTWSNNFTNAIRVDFPNEYYDFKSNTVANPTLNMKFVKLSFNEYEVVISGEFSLGETRMSNGEFNYGLFSQSMENKEYVKGEETKYYILTVKGAKNYEPPYQAYVYEVYLLDNHSVIASTTVFDRNNKNLLTPAKQEGVKLLFEHNPQARLEETSMVHFKQDRPNGVPWQKDSISVLNGLFNERQNNRTEIKLDTVKKDLEAEDAEEDIYYSDGAVRTYFGKRYERNPRNRKRAIEIHGLTCMACGFNFEETYGKHGKDFIEVHHIKPLSNIGAEVEINPEEDLVPLCSNCHRMVHREKKKVLSLEELKAIIS